MSLVDVHNEWDPLEEVVIGSVAGARTPLPDPGLLATDFPNYAMDEIPSGPFDRRIIEETEIELDGLCRQLATLGVTVRRPEPRDIGAQFSTPDWQTDGVYDYCPRDVLLTIGNMVIETPMVLRSRFLEPFAYKSLLIEYFSSGARWISAPKPRLLDTMYDVAASLGRRLQDFEPAFDAANVLRFGTDLLYLVSDSGNEMGGRWLQSAVGDGYTVHLWKGIYASTHVDSTIMPLQPGLVLLNPERVNDTNLPEFLRSWDRIYTPPMVDTGFVGKYPRCSTWIGMNLLVIKPGLAIVDDRQPELIKLLEAHKIDVLALRLTHARSLGGGFHCVSLDVRRRGKLETYR
jgi:glycine amidinotransferase/scyllo-inosamine-4-phosphate amidinotransferase 1